MKPKFEKITSHCRDLIRSRKWAPGQPLPSEVKLAAQFRVHRLTMRKALAELEKDGVLIRKRGRGTCIRSELPPAYSQNPPVLLIGDTNHDVYREFFDALTAQFQQRGVNLLLFNPAQATLELLREQAAQAHTIISLVESWKEAVPHIPAGRRRLLVDLFHGGAAADAWDERCYVVSGDAYSAARMATEHLLALGHRQIAFLGPEVLLRHMTPTPSLAGRDQRFGGYQDALLLAGLAPRVVGIPGTGKTNWVDLGDRFMRHYLQTETNLPTAFVCDGDFRAAHLLRVGLTMGLQAPRNFSAIGLGNTPWCDLLPAPLTSVSFEEKEVASVAATLCQQAAPPQGATLRIRPRLILRKSTAAPPPPELPSRGGTGKIVGQKTEF